jgi:hypothetical protein
MYRAINKKFLKTVQAIIDRNSRGISISSDEYGDSSSYEYNEYCWNNDKCIDLSRLEAITNFLEYHSSSTEDENSRICIAKVAGIFAPFIIGDEDCSAYRLFNKLGLYDIFLSPSGGYYISDLYYVITHFMELDGYDESSLSDGENHNNICTVDSLNYVTAEVPTDKYNHDFYPKVGSNFDNICTIDSKTKRLRINGFYNQYSLKTSKPNLKIFLKNEKRKGSKSL